MSISWAKTQSSHSPNTDHTTNNLHRLFKAFRFLARAYVPDPFTGLEACVAQLEGSPFKVCVCVVCVEGKVVNLCVMGLWCVFVSTPLEAGLRCAAGGLALKVGVYVCVMGGGG